MPERNTWLTQLLAALLAALALAAFAALLIPFEWLQPLGALVRRPDDVSPERVIRFRQVGAVAFAGFVYFGIVVFRYPLVTAHFFAGVVADLKATIRYINGRFARNANAKRPLRDWLPLVTIVGLGIALRLRYLNVPVSYDEAYSFLNFARRPWYEAIADYNNTNNHIFNSFLMHWCYRIFGQQEWALRLPVLFMGSLAVIIAWPWARTYVSKPAALLTCTLIATSPTMIDYSVNARGYMYVLAFAMITDLALERIRRTSNATLAFTIASIAAILGFWSMPIMVYPVAGLWAYHLLWCIKSPLPLGRGLG